MGIATITKSEQQLVNDILLSVVSGFLISIPLSSGIGLAVGITLYIYLRGREARRKK